MCLLCSSAAYSNCWVAASEKYNIDPWLLYSIGWEESNLVSDAVNTNSDGSRDIGIMQNELLFKEGFINILVKIKNSLTLCLHAFLYIRE